MSLNDKAKARMNPNLNGIATDQFQEHKPNQFPVEVFPDKVQKIITDTNECLKFPVDFTGASVLFAVSVGVGNTYKVQVKKGWREGAVLYIALVGRPGTNKTAPLRWGLKPIEQIDNRNYQIYQSEKREYDSNKQQGDSEPAEPPVWKQHLVSDFTLEAICGVHNFNQRGLGVHADELATWFKNFNRYHRGGDQEFWLSNWSGNSIKVNRKKSDPINISLPFISVCGCIQPGVIHELAEHRTENGFMDRLLFVVPDDLKKEYWSEEELTPEIEKNWNDIISKLLNLPIAWDSQDNRRSKILSFSPKAKQILFEWQRELTDQCNQQQDDTVSGIYAKMEMYCARLALCLEMMRYACGQSDKQSIGVESVQGAIKLVEYFKASAVKVHSIVSNVNPLDRLPGDKQKLYQALPESFTTSEGVHFADNIGMSERTFKYFISNRDLFNNSKRGEYEKRF